jgi:Mrp family chromosome partitioning ATPase
MFDLPLSPGLCDLLAGQTGTLATIHQIKESRLHIFTAGKLNSDAASGLARHELDEVLTELRSQYDYILLDTSPLLVVPDANMIGRHVDGVVFSVRSGVSLAADVFAGFEQSCENRLPFVGVVVNGVGQNRKYLSAYSNPNQVNG